MPTKHIDKLLWERIEQKTVDIVILQRKMVKDTDVLQCLIESALNNVSNEELSELITKYRKSWVLTRSKKEMLIRIRFKLFYEMPKLFLVLLLIFSLFIFFVVSTHDRDTSNSFYVFVTITYIIIFSALWDSIGDPFKLNDAELNFIEKNDFLSKEFNKALNKKGTKLSLRFLFALNKEIKVSLLNIERLEKNNEVKKKEKMRERIKRIGL